MGQISGRLRMSRKVKYPVPAHLRGWQQLFEITGYVDLYREFSKSRNRLLSAREPITTDQ
jgi:hypothetical protein